ncbi:MAG: Hsp20/alpha crystallin family protein [Pseudomonadota bacterium]
MANLMQFTPFTPLARIDDVFDNFFEGFLRPVRADWQGAQPMRIKLDVSENDNAYTVRAEIPGVKKEDIQVTIDGDQVTISAEVARQAEKKDEKVLYSERYYGKVYRSFTLGQDVDETNAEAKYDAGVLELKLPKKVATSAKKLTIQ